MSTTKILQSALREALYKKAKTKREDSVKLATRVERADLCGTPARTLIAGLRRCRPHRRCGSPACPQCAKAEQALLASLTEKFTADQTEGFKIGFATIVPLNSSVPKGLLCEFDLANFRRRVRDGLAKTSALCAVGAVDVTLNEHSDDVFDAYWSPHAHVIVATDDIDGFANGLRAAFPWSTNTPRPVVVKAWDGDPRVFSYLFKADFARRISIEQTERFDPRTGKTRLCRGTTYARLRVCERIELALFLDAMGLGGRLILRNARFYAAGTSLRLQLISS